MNKIRNFSLIFTLFASVIFYSFYNSGTKCTRPANEWSQYDALDEVYDNKNLLKGGKILAFEFLKLPPENKPVMLKNKGNEFNDAIKKALMNSRRGSSILFHNIKLKYPDGRTIQLPAMSCSID